MSCSERNRCYDGLLMKKQSLNQIKRQRIVLDFLPFIYNVFVFIVMVMQYFMGECPIYAWFGGFSIITLTDLLYRSKDNNYCEWHRTPIYICFLVIFSLIWNEFESLSEKSWYVYIYMIYLLLLFLFIISAIYFQRFRIKRDLELCKEEIHCLSC